MLCRVVACETRLRWFRCLCKSVTIRNKCHQGSWTTLWPVVIVFAYVFVSRDLRSYLKPQHARNGPGPNLGVRGGKEELLQEFLRKLGIESCSTARLIEVAAAAAIVGLY